MKMVCRCTHKWLSFLLIIVFIISSAQVSWANVSSPYSNSNNRNSQSVEARPSRPTKNGLIVKFKANQNQFQADQVVKNNAKKNKPSFKEKDIKVKSVSKKIATIEIQSDETIDSLIQSLSEDPLVESIQQDYELQSFSLDVTSQSSFNNSVLFPANQWALLNEGQVINGKPGTAGADINLAPWIKASHTTSEIVIAVLDTGIDTTHDSLIGKTTAGFDFVNYDSSVFDPGDTYHGTQIASLIAANDLQNQLRGAADNVVIMPLKFIQDGYGYTSDALAAIDYAKENGIRIINCSWGSTQFNPMLKDAMAENSGILFVCAAGNNGGSTPVYPAAFDLPNVVSAASIDNIGSLSAASSYGASVSLAAPGEDIYTVAPDNSYAFASGTSMAAGYVSAAAGMYLGTNERVTAPQLKSLLMESVTPSSGLNGYVKSGGYLNISQMLATDAMPVSDIEEGNTSIESEFDPDTDAKELLNSSKLYTELTDEQKDVVHDTFFVRDDTMTECANAGFTIKESIRKSIIMQRLNISLSDTLLMIENYSSEAFAYSQAEYFIHIKFGYRWFDSDSANGLVKYLIEGYPARNVIFSYIVSQAYQISQDNILIKDMPSKQEMDRILQEILHIELPAAVPIEQEAFIEDLITPDEEMDSDSQDEEIDIDEDSNEEIDTEESDSNVDGNNSEDESVSQAGEINTEEESNPDTDEIDIEEDANSQSEEIENDEDFNTQTKDIIIEEDSDSHTDEIRIEEEVNSQAEEVNIEEDSDTWPDENTDAASSDLLSYVKPAGRVFSTNKLSTTTFTSFTNDVENLSGSELEGDTQDITDNAESNDTYSDTDESSKSDNDFFNGFINGENDQVTSIAGLQIEDLSGIKTAELFKSLIRIYCVDPEVIARFIMQDGLTVEDFYNRLQCFEMQYGLFAAHKNEALDIPDAPLTEPTRTEFKINTTDGVNVANGSLDYIDNLVTIPGRNGLDLNLTLRYNSSNSNSFEAFGMEYANYTSKVKHLSPLDYMANGWSFAFPYVIRPDYSGSVYEVCYHSANGEVYEYDNSSPSKLKKHPQTDMIFGVDEYGYCYPSARYFLRHNDGIYEYFDSDGRLIAIEDRIGNRIKFGYGTQVVYITDTAGQITTITQSDTAAVITLPDNSTITFELEKQAEDIGYRLLLNKKTDQIGRVTTYTNTTKTYAYSYYPNAVLPPTVVPKSGSVRSSDQDARLYYFTRYIDHIDFSTDELPGVRVNNLRYYAHMYLPYTYYVEFVHWCPVTLPKVNTPTPTDVDISYVLLTNVTYPSGAQTNYSYIDKDLSHLYIKGTNPRLSSQSDATDGRVFNSIQYDYVDNNSVLPPVLTTNIIYPDGTTKRYQVADGLLKSVTLLYNDKPKSQETYYYNDLRQKTRCTNTIQVDNGISSNSTWEEYQYDSNSHLAKYWDKQVIWNTLNTEHVTDFVYSNYGKLISKTYKKDANTTITQTNTIGSNGGLISSSQITDSVSGVIEKTEYTRDTYGNVLSEKKYIDSINTITTAYTYQNGVFPASVTTAGVTQASYTYDLYGHILTDTDGNGNTTNYQYDIIGRLVKKINPDGSFITVIYDDISNKMIQTNELGRIIETNFNGLGYVVSEIDITNPSLPIILHTYSYDDLLRMTQEIDARNTATDYTYDYMNRMLTKTIGGTLYQESYLYEYLFSHTFSRMTKTVEGEANAPSIKTVTYTNLYGLTESTGRIINNTEQLTTFTYDYLGNQLTSQTPDGIITSFQYDGANRLIKTTNPDGSVYQQTYDWLGRKITATDPKGQTSNYTYDSLGRLTKEEIPFSDNYKSVKSYFYDNCGNITSQRQSNNLPSAAYTESRTDYAYNNRNFMTKASSYNNGVEENYVTYTYDAAGNKLSMGAANETQVTQYEYDKQSRLTKLTDPMGHYESYSYDACSNLITKTDRMNTVISNEYDGLNRLVSVTAKKNGSTTAAEGMSYAYYKTGTKKQDINENLTTDYVYDDAGRLISQTETINTSTVVNGEILPAVTTVKNQTYDARDNRISLTVTTNGAPSLAEAFDFDSMNRLLNVYDNGALEATYTYDLNGNRKSLTYANGVTTVYEYNKANLITSLINKKDAVIQSSFIYTYRLDGNQVSKKDNLGINTTYSYDALGRLINESETTPANVRGATEQKKISKWYTYDNANNRHSMTLSTSIGLFGTVDNTIVYNYNANNQLITEAPSSSIDPASVITYQYDLNGNQVSKSSGGQSESYVYDVFNRLAQMNSGGIVTSYRYKSDGLRLSVNTKPSSGGSQTSIHVWDGNNISFELNGSGNLTNKYIRGLNLIKYYPSNGITNARYYSFNAHGDVVQLTNTQGTVIKNYFYDAFGVEIIADSDPWRYCGDFFDLGNGIDTQYFTGMFNASKTSMTNPNGIIAETIVLEASESHSSAYTPNMRLSTDTIYELEFDYWSDTNDNNFYAGLFPDNLPSRFYLTPTQNVQKAVIEICSSDTSMADALLRFVSYGGTGNVYVANVRFYNKETVQNMQYLDISKAIKINDFSFLSNASITQMTPPGSTMVTNVLSIKPIVGAVGYTPAMLLKQNTEYILEFDYWGDVNGDIIITDLYPDDLPETGIVVSKTVNRAKLTISSDKANMSNANLRFFVHTNSGNVYVANILFYEKSALGAIIDSSLFQYCGKFFDLSSGIDTEYFTGMFNASKTSMTNPNGIIAETIVLEASESHSSAYTPNMRLSTDTIYELEFDYWSDTNDNNFYTGLFPDNLPSRFYLTPTQNVQKAVIEICSSDTSMADALLRFVSYGGTGNVYVSNVRFYNKGTVQNMQYLDISKATKINDFSFLSNASITKMTPPGSTMITDVLSIKPIVSAVGYTPAMLLKQNTEYILEFDYWGDVNGDIIITDLYPDDLPETGIVVSKTVNRAKLTISSDKANMSNANLRFFVHTNSGNVYVANILFYEKNALGAIIDSNPFRYCGEYYDLETKTYYLKARVYEPTTGRFLSEDSNRVKRSNLYDPTEINQSIMLKGGCLKIPGINKYWVDDPLSLNLYTYTYNNPLRYTDPSGNIVIPLVAIPIAEALEVLLPIAGAAALAWWNAPGNEIKKQATEALSNAVEATKRGISSIADNIIASSSITGSANTRTLSDVKAKEPSTKNQAYQMAYVIPETGALVRMPNKMTYEEALLTLYALGVDKSTASLLSAAHPGLWGVYTNEQAYAKALAVATGAYTSPEVHASGMYGHYHDKKHIIHIWFGGVLNY